VFEEITILIVEDDPMTSTVIADAIAHMGTVYVASTCAMAETYAREFKPELFLLDIYLPDGSGIELCQKLKESTFVASSKYIFVTGERDVDTELNAYSLGADDFIKKPVNIPTLKARVKLQLSLLKQRRQLMQSNQVQSRLFATLPSYVSCWDNNLQNIYHNDVHHAWFSQTQGNQHFSLSELFTPAQFISVKRHLVAMKLNGSESFELSNVVVRGQVRSLSVLLISETLASGKLGFVMILSDITHQKSKLQEFISDREKYESAVSTIDGGVISTNSDAKITYINDIAKQLLNVNKDDALGKSIDDIMQIQDALDGARIPHSIHYALQEKRSTSSLPEASLRNKNGELISIEELSSPILNSGGELVGAISVFHDVTQALHHQRELEKASNHDPLTGLPDKVLLLDRASQRLKQTVIVSKAPLDSELSAKCALVVINVNGFHHVTEQHGYDIGDQLLVDISSYLSTFLHDTDTLSRHIADEFIMLLHNIDSKDELSKRCEKLVTSFRKVVLHNKAEFDLDIIMGVAIEPETSVDAHSLLRMANVALHKAKHEGRSIELSN
jgi:diguanylate cyclase (GGDEF)-like protein/PAS domain S-box-containing protein